MGKKVTIGQLAQQLSINCGMDGKLCESFLKSLFKIIGNGLEEEGIVKIKELGTFKLTTVSARKSVDVNSGEDNEIPAHRKVVFIPSKELASAVNSPFDMFETIEISDNAPEEAIMEADGGSEKPAVTENTEVEDTPEEEMDPEIQDTPEADKDNSENQASTEVQETQEMEKIEGPAVEEESVVEEPAVEEEAVEKEPAEEEESVAVRATGRRGFGHGFIWGMVVALIVVIGACGVLYYMYKDNFIPVANLNQKENAVTKNEIADAALDNVDASEALLNTDNGEATVVDNTDLPEAAVPTEPSDSKPVYDTITDTRYLTTMAKDHYGNYHLWPYIYKENEKILGHPNRIRPGTRIVIPDLRKYGVDPKNKDDIEKAKKLGAEIYSRYQ